MKQAVLIIVLTFQKICAYSGAGVQVRGGAARQRGGGEGAASQAGGGHLRPLPPGRRYGNDNKNY